MTRKDLQLMIEERINRFMHCCGAVGNSHLSQCDFNEVARPVATLAVLSGFASRSCGHLSSYPQVSKAYLTSLSFIVRIGDTFVSDMRRLIDDLYDNVRRAVSEDDILDNWDLWSVIEDMYEEAKQ